MGKRYTIAVDFDGVLCDVSGTVWVAHHLIPGPPVEGAIEWLREMGKAFDLVIYSTRGQTWRGRSAIRRWLRRHGYKLPATAKIACDKAPALIYLDDRAIRFEGPGTFPTRQQVHDARPWHRKGADVTHQMRRLAEQLMRTEDSLAWAHEEALASEDLPCQCHACAAARKRGVDPGGERYEVYRQNNPEED